MHGIIYHFKLYLSISCYPEFIDFSIPDKQNYAFNMRQMNRKYIGDLIRLSRKAAGLSQMELAERVGVSYQQIQKYEKGISEMGLTRLSQIAEALNMPLASFIPDNEKMMVSESIGRYGAASDDEAELLNLFRKIKSKKLKHGLLETIKGIAGLSESKAKKKSKASAS